MNYSPKIEKCLDCEQKTILGTRHNCIRGLTENINRLRQEMFEFQREFLKIIKMVAK